MIRSLNPILHSPCLADDGDDRVSFQSRPIALDRSPCQPTDQGMYQCNPSAGVHTNPRAHFSLFRLPMLNQLHGFDQNLPNLPESLHYVGRLNPLTASDTILGNISSELDLHYLFLTILTFLLYYSFSKLGWAD